MNEKIPPPIEKDPKDAQGVQGDQVPIVSWGNNVVVVHPKLTNGEIRKVLLALSLAVITLLNFSM